MAVTIAKKFHAITDDKQIRKNLKNIIVRSQNLVPTKRKIDNAGDYISFVISSLVYCKTSGHLCSVLMILIQIIFSSRCSGTQSLLVSDIQYDKYDAKYNVGFIEPKTGKDVAISFPPGSVVVTLISMLYQETVQIQKQGGKFTYSTIKRYRQTHTEILTWGESKLQTVSPFKTLEQQTR